MIIDKILLQNEEPRFKGVLWADPIENGIALKLYNNGKWHVVGGSGNGCNCSNVIISYDTYNGTWELVQGDFEKAFSAMCDGNPVDIKIYDICGDGYKPHPITSFVPIQTGDVFQGQEIPIDFISIVTNTLRDIDDIIVWTADGIYYYTPPSEGGDEPSVPK